MWMMRLCWVRSPSPVLRTLGHTRCVYTISAIALRAHRALSNTKGVPSGLLSTRLRRRSTMCRFFWAVHSAWTMATCLAPGRVRTRRLARGLRQPPIQTGPRCIGFVPRATTPVLTNPSLSHRGGLGCGGSKVLHLIGRGRQLGCVGPRSRNGTVETKPRSQRYQVWVGDTLCGATQVDFPPRRLRQQRRTEVVRRSDGENRHGPCGSDRVGDPRGMAQLRRGNPRRGRTSPKLCSFGDPGEQHATAFAGARRTDAPAFRCRRPPLATARRPTGVRLGRDGHFATCC